MRICVRCGVKSTCSSARAIAWSLLRRIDDFWHVWAATNASRSTDTTTPTRSHLGPRAVSGVPQRPTSACAVGVTGGAGGSDSWTELGPDVRKQHDHQDHDGTEDRDSKHRELEALLVRLKRQELDLPLAASVVDHRSVSPPPPGCGVGPPPGLDGPA